MRRWGEGEVAAGQRDRGVRRDGRAIVEQCAVGDSRDDDGGEGIAGGGRVVRIVEAEHVVGDRQDGVFLAGLGRGGAAWRVVDREDVEGELVGALIGVLAAVEHAAGVLHLEGEAGRGAVGGVAVQLGRERDLAGIDAVDINERARSDWRAVVQQGAALEGEGREDDPERRVRIRIVGRIERGRVRERADIREVGERQRVGQIFGHRDGRIDADGRIVDRVDREGQGADDRIEIDTGGLGTAGRAGDGGGAATVLHLERNVEGGGGVLARRVNKQVRRAIEVAGQYRGVRLYVGSAKLQRGPGGQHEGAEFHGENAVLRQVFRIAEAEFRRTAGAEAVGAAFGDGDGLRVALRSIVDVQDGDADGLLDRVGVDVREDVAAAILHLEGEGVAADGVERARVTKRASGEGAASAAGDGDRLAGRDGSAVEGQRALSRIRNGRDDQVREGSVCTLAGVVRIGEAEIGRHEGVDGFFRHREVERSADGGVVERGNGEGQRVGRLIRVLERQTAAVLNLEDDLATDRGTELIRRRLVRQSADIDVRPQNRRIGGDRVAIEEQRARADQVDVLNRKELIRRIVIRIGEAEVGRPNGVLLVFADRYGLVSASRLLVRA